LRTEFTTTSDWSTLELLTPENVLTMRLFGTEGAPTVADVGVGRMSLGQPLAMAEADKQVGLMVELALDPAAVGTALRFRVQKGDVNGSVVRLSAVTDGAASLLKEVDHQRIVTGSGGMNPLVFTVSLAPLAGLEPEIVPTGAGKYPHLLWAFYYPWYTKVSWRSPELSDHPLEPYASADRETIERHIRQAKEAGIDGFISSWWGPGSETDANLVTLLDVAQEESFLVAIYFETLNESGARPAEECVRWLEYAIRNYGDHPAYARVEGMPLLVVWASGAAPLETWRETFDKLRQAGRDAFYIGMGYQVSILEVFDGLHEYGVFTYEDLEGIVPATGTGVRYFGLLSEGSRPKLWAATVQPGYDDRLITGRQGLVQEREDGAYYRRTWEAALSSTPDWIFITSWNEWWETTHIEPGQTFGSLYLEITREFAQRWKGD
jgi:hypothetical protein